MSFLCFVGILEQSGRKEAKEAIKSLNAKSACAEQSILKNYWEQLKMNQNMCNIWNESYGCLVSVEIYGS